MSGRGRGINNNPAWMNQPAGGGGAPPPSQDDFGRRAPPRDYQQGQQQHGGSSGSGGPPMDHYNNRGPPRGNRIPPPGRYDNRRDDRYDDRGGPPRGGGGGYGGGGGGYNHNNRNRGPPPPRRPRPPPPGGITFRSAEEEREWVEERRRKRQARPSKFDLQPTPEQTAAIAAAAAAALASVGAIGSAPSSAMSVGQPQQTRHARRLYIGNLPYGTTEQEIHTFFRQSIEQALTGPPLQEDPILSVYINHERHFCFLEFKTVEMASACMALDGLDLNGRGKVRVKRPNDYNPAQAPPLSALNSMPLLDVSRLGIVGQTVEDGPNKIFIGGLHYHLQEQQVLELLHAFGKVKAFHLVKQSPDSDSSKGYCFVEYADPAITAIAVAGLTDMDIGGGKSLTARMAGGQSGGHTAPAVLVQAAPAASHAGSAPADHTIISGYDIEVLVDAAMGKCPMPRAPQYLDPYGMPLTRLSPALGAPAAAANAYAPPAPPPPPIKQEPAPPVQTRVLVLLNMVADEDLATAEDHTALTEEVREECAKLGQLRDIKVPRAADGMGVEPSAVRKIFLEYTTAVDAAKASNELNGRQFGPNTVVTSFYSEADFAAGRLR